MSEPWLICTDLDRTLLPNGEQAESRQARRQFRDLAAHPQVVVIYASGRDKHLVEQALNEWELPYPDYLIADVGSTIYQRQTKPKPTAELKQKAEPNSKAECWQQWQSWRQKLQRDWRGLTPGQILQQLPRLPGLTPQPAHQQGEFKLSFFVEPTEQLTAISDRLKQALKALEIKANCIPSINEHENHGLIDILPSSANKLLAIRFLLQSLKLNPQQLLYAGDSGNDMEVLASEFKSVLVANATEEVRQMALYEAQKNANAERLYLAKGSSSELNGCYAAGIVEGFEHFFPEFNHSGS